MNPAILGTWTYLEFAACVAAWTPIMEAVHFAHRRDAVPRFEGRWLRRLARTAARLSPQWRFRVRGAPPPDIDHAPYVVVANHQSNADPFLLSHLPWDMRWVAKEELFRAPVVGRLLRLSGDVPLRRGEGDSVRKMLGQCRDTLARGLSVMLFPEGTRSKDGALRPFKDGAFQLAIEAQVPILPVVVEGTSGCMPKGSPWLRRARATATILEPIPTAGLARGDVAALRDAVRARIAAALSSAAEDVEPPPRSARRPRHRGDELPERARLFQAARPH